jgi:hypothetical protein
VSTLLSIKQLVLSFSISLLVFGCGGSDGDTPTPTPEPQNVAPTISNMQVDDIFERASMSFIAEASDSDGSISSYQWQQTTGTTVDDLSSDSENLTFTVPNVLAD